MYTVHKVEYFVFQCGNGLLMCCNLCAETQAASTASTVVAAMPTSFISQGTGPDVAGPRGQGAAGPRGQGVVVRAAADSASWQLADWRRGGKSWPECANKLAVPLPAPGAVLPLLRENEL